MSLTDIFLSRRGWFQRAVATALLLWVASLVHADVPIAIEGVTDRAYDLYEDRVSFRVPTVSGYTYRAELDGARVPTDQWVEVNRVDYHELAVWRTNVFTAEGTNRLVRFIVQSSERSASGATENGLPPWTPYPPIPSAPEEVTGAVLDLVMPAIYPSGLEIPVVAWLRSTNGGPVRANGYLKADGHPDIRLFRGAGSGFLAAEQPTDHVQYDAVLAGLPVQRMVLLETNTAWTSVSGSLSGTVIWPDNARIAVTGHLTIPAGATLTIGAGVVVRLNAGVNITNLGTVVINGTLDAPTVFTPVTRAQPWGGFLLTASTSRLEARGTIFVGSGADPNAVSGHRHEQCLFYMDNHARLALTDCAAIYLAGQFGHGVDRGSPLIQVEITRTLIQRCITGGEWNGSALKLLQSALIEVPYATGEFYNGDEDGIYFTTGEYEVRDSLIGWTRDDGIDSGSGGAGTVTVSNTWVESTYHEAFAWSGGGRVTTNLNTVSLNCGQGIECGYSSTTGSPLDYADHCLILGNATGARFGDNYDWTFNGFLRVTNSILLNNYRDVWGFNWQKDAQGWLYRSNQMDIQGNFLTAPLPRHPDNAVWNPAVDAARLAPFMTTPPDAPVGMGFAVWTNRYALGALFQGTPVGLSSFTTHPVNVDYAFENDNATLATGTLTFVPGETIKRIYPAGFDLAAQATVRLVLLNPQQGILTGETNVLYQGTVAPPQVSCLAGGTQFELGRLIEGVPLGLSVPSALPVSVTYQWEATEGVFVPGTVRFEPGQTLAWITAPDLPVADLAMVHLQLGGVTGATLAGASQYYWVKTQPLAVAETFTLIPLGAVWKYLDTGTNLGLPWSATRPDGWTGTNFIDTAWPSGPALLGYGNDGAEATTNSYGGVTSSKHLTYYYRHAFLVTNAPALASLTFNLLRDDGAVVYLNGVEVYRENMPDGVITNLSVAKTNVGGTATVYESRTFAVSALPQPLVEGTNLLAVELHQSGKSSSVIAFDLEVTGTTTPPASLAPTLYSGTFGGQWVLGWGDPGYQLQTATNLAGPWTALTAPSPWLVNPTNQHEFFRLQQR